MPFPPNLASTFAPATRPSAAPELAGAPNGRRFSGFAFGSLSPSSNRIAYVPSPFSASITPGYHLPLLPNLHSILAPTDRLPLPLDDGAAAGAGADAGLGGLPPTSLTCSGLALGSLSPSSNRIANVPSEFTASIVPG